MTNTSGNMSDFLIAAKKRLQERGEWGIPQTAREIELDRIAEANDLYRDINDCSEEDLASWIAEVEAEND